MEEEEKKIRRSLFFNIYFIIYLTRRDAAGSIPAVGCLAIKQGKALLSQGESKKRKGRNLERGAEGSLAKSGGLNSFYVTNRKLRTCGTIKAKESDAYERVRCLNNNERPNQKNARHSTYLTLRFKSSAQWTVNIQPEFHFHLSLAIGGLASVTSSVITVRLSDAEPVAPSRYPPAVRH